MSNPRQMIDSASAVLLDFDGPVCSVFAGYSAAEIAETIRARLATVDSATPIPPTGDPLELLRDARRHSKILGALAEEMLALAELAAVKSAAPTDGVREFLERAKHLATPVAIVSNNSDAAIRAYLHRASMESLISEISARDPHDARLMKPDPWALRKALTLLRCDPENAVMVGDSNADIMAARPAGVSVIAYANKEWKKDAFSASDANAVITSMRDLLN